MSKEENIILNPGGIMNVSLKYDLIKILTTWFHRGLGGLV